MKAVPILYENEEIFIINKEAGIAVQGGKGIAHPLDALLAQQCGGKVYPVHRLDRDTAGILVVAKTPAAASYWTKLLSAGEVKKEYTAICAGFPPAASGVIKLPVEIKGRVLNAVTHYHVIEKAQIVSEIEIPSKIFKFSVVGFVLETGRMHQIRIHASSSGFPLAGDDKYGDFKLNRELKKSFGVKNLQLAACKLTIPINGAPKTFEIPLPPHMQKFYNCIKERAEACKESLK